MLRQPRIFVSAVSKELKSARELVAQTLIKMGYQPVWQEIFGTEAGDVRQMLRHKIDECKGVVQLVGHCYGVEPPIPENPSDRMSFTQYEAHYARDCGKDVWYLILDESFPTDLDKDSSTDASEPESEELARLQVDYRRCIADETDIFHMLTNEDALKTAVHEMRDDLKRAWASARRWAAVVIILLVSSVALGGWSLFDQTSHRPPNPITDEHANTAFISRDYATAFDIYAQLADLTPANVNYHRRIEECARRGHLEKPFLERYLALVGSQPTNATYHNYLGNAYVMLDAQDNDGEAREHYEKALQLDPKLSAPLANLGILAHRMGKSAEAESFFKRYLTAEPSDAQGWVNLGLLYVARVQASPGDSQAVAEAEDALRRAIQFEPSSASAYKGLGRLFVANGRGKDALDAFQRSLALDFEQPQVRQQVELLSWESGGGRLAGSQADDFKTRGKDNEAADVPAAILAMQLLDEVRFERAEAICLEWSELEPENPLVWRLLGHAYEGQGRKDDARRAISKIEDLLKSNK